tara:strand:- start:196 stop:915 length:720 start_codon:yes stop_codon:yes gene_type:complete
MTKYKIDVATDQNDLFSKTVEIIIDQINHFLSIKKRVQISLSGGSTPAEVYRLLSREDIDWSRVDIFLGDERWVDTSDKSSNALMINKTLLSDFPGSKASFHAIPTTELSTPAESAVAFSKLLREKCIGDPPVFDLILLGLGEDGHTASLFPYTESLNVFDQWTTISHGKGQDRITLTAPVLSAATMVIFLVSGLSKQIALKRLIDPFETFERTPAKLVRPSNPVLILSDQLAAKLISK